MAEPSLDLWGACKARLAPDRLEGELVRVVESQEQVATLGLVDDLEEQELLEGLIEGSKPPQADGSENLHYLLATPFRYPPLPYGSRFGGRFEPSLCYGAKGIGTALAETAYYRFLFWSAMAEPPPSGRLQTQHTAFGARYCTERGLQLQRPPCAEFHATLADPIHYAATQQLGSALREAGVEAFEYPSARDPQRGENVALFRPTAFAASTPHWQQAWLCETQADVVTFANRDMGHLSFPINTFLVAGALPRPAP